MMKMRVAIKVHEERSSGMEVEHGLLRLAGHRDFAA